MASRNKVIITCAVTGAIHTPSMFAALPVTAEEIADAAIGAAIVHLHARDPVTGQPDQTPEAFEPFLKVIKQRSSCVINLTTGGAPWMRVEERVTPAAVFRPEVASLNMGSMNFGLFPMLERFKTFKQEWERQHLVFRNSFQDIEYVLRTLGGAGVRFEFECYDISHLYNLAHFLERGLVRPPLFVQSVFELLGGSPCDTSTRVISSRSASRPRAEAGDSSRSAVAAIAAMIPAVGIVKLSPCAEHGGASLPHASAVTICQ